MCRSLFFAALAALATNALAQQSANFVGMTWAGVTVGQTWPIYWTAGNYQSVSLTLGNDSWSMPIFNNQPASPGSYQWTVAVPAGFMPGNYTLSLSQVGAGTNYSPLFPVAYRAEPSATTLMLVNGTAITAAPTVTVVWFDEECGCHKTTTTTSSCPPGATGTGAAATPYVWYDETCGCSKTAMSPAPTMAPNNYTAPAPTAMWPPPATTTMAPVQYQYQGSAVRLSASAWGLVVLFAAVVAA